MLRASAILWGLGFLVTGSSSNEVLPAAITIDPSGSWDGDDGPWSTFAIHVGTPAQDLRVLVSTAATSTWVVQAPLGCEGYALADCANARGGNFSNSSSTSWTDKGVFELFVEQNLGYQAEGDYGFDTLGLGFHNNSGLTINPSLITLITTPDYIVGSLGLNPRPTNFTDFTDSATSFLTLLFNQNSIPSLSYSYTAGAQYALGGVLGSLILGGYDESLYIPNELSFDFDNDQTRDLTVGLQGITTSTAQGEISLLPTLGLYLIDSTISQIYLPADACAVFEKTFGLVLDSSGYYLINNTQHASLLALNPNITFTLGTSTSSPETINITLPYASFDLNLTYPIIPSNSSTISASSNTTRYFPLIQATNSSQYTLGRTFLQEAYLTVDYSRSNFSVSQRQFSSNTPSHIVDITPPNSTTTSAATPSSSTSTSSKKTKSISAGTIAGICVGALALCVLAASAFYIWRHHRTPKIIFPLSSEESDVPPPGYNYTTISTPPSSVSGSGTHRSLSTNTPSTTTATHELLKAELASSMYGSDTLQAGQPFPVLGRSKSVGVDGVTRFELDAPHGVVEIGGAHEGDAEVSSANGGSGRGEHVAALGLDVTPGSGTDTGRYTWVDSPTVYHAGG